jgi:hypothetical protein
MNNRASWNVEVMSFLGLVKFSMRFVPKFATIREPLRCLTRKGVQFIWGSEQEQTLKER